MLIIVPISSYSYSFVRATFENWTRWELFSIKIKIRGKEI